MKLSHAKIAKTNKKALLGDGGGGGLWLYVNPLQDGSFSKRFAFRYRRGAKYGEVPIGKWPDVSLVDARAKAAEFRAQLAKDIDPASERKKARAPVVGAITFKQATLDYVEVQRSKWRALDTAEDWLRAFKLYLFPVIGDMAIADVGDTEARAALGPIFKRSPDLGWRTAARAKAVFDYARAMKVTERANPFEKRGFLVHIFPMKTPTQHRPTIPWKQMPELYAALVLRGDTMPALAVRLCVALALRPGEARFAQFQMLDLEAGTITLPMTKSGRPFIAPLNPAALAVIERCVQLRMNDYIFPGRGPNKPIHETSMGELTQDLCQELFGVYATIHGVSRSAFADYCYENDVASDAVIESALNHVVGNATTRSYKRGNLLDLRRKLGIVYSDFLLGKSNVINFPSKTAAAE
jgi:integrase